MERGVAFKGIILNKHNIAFVCFFCVLGGSLGRYVQRKLAALNLWEDAFHSVKENLKAGILICEQWVSACEYLTGQLWQRYTLHPWKNEKYFPESLAKLGKRLDEVEI